MYIFSVFRFFHSKVSFNQLKVDFICLGQPISTQIQNCVGGQWAKLTQIRENRRRFLGAIKFLKIWRYLKKNRYGQRTPPARRCLPTVPGSSLTITIISSSTNILFHSRCYYSLINFAWSLKKSLVNGRIICYLSEKYFKVWNRMLFD